MRQQILLVNSNKPSPHGGEENPALRPGLSLDIDVDLLNTRLESMGYGLEISNDEAAAFEAACIRQHSLVVIRHMPEEGIDGLALVRFLKGSSVTAGIPLILYSSIGDLMVMNTAYQMGASFYLRLNAQMMEMRGYEVVGEICETAMRLIDLKRRTVQFSPMNGNSERISGLAPSHLQN